MKIAGLMLAAGRGERLGGAIPKPLALIEGRALLDYALEAMLSAGIDPVFVVVGYRGEEVALVVADGVSVIENPGWAEGVASSLRMGLKALENKSSVEAVCVGLADQPRIGAAAYRRLAEAHAAGARLAVATYGGVRSNPVLLDRSLWSEACALEGDVGARALMPRHEVVEVPCDDTGDPTDVDTPIDLISLDQEQVPEGPPPGG